MQVPFTCVQSDFTGPCTRFNTLISRICEQVDTSSGVVFADVYANRVNYSASQNPSSLFVATDQNIIYQSRLVGGQAAWAYASGIIYGTLSGSGSLVSGDAGALLLTNGPPVKLYRWSGSSWQDVTPSSGTATSSGAFTLMDTHANRLANYLANKYPVGQQFFESDRAVTYIVEMVSGTKHWVYESGTYNDTFANRPTDLTVYDDGFMFRSKDHLVCERWSGSALNFTWASGVTIAPFTVLATLAAVLVASEVGWPVYDTTYQHMWYWNVSGWNYAPGDCGSQYIVMAPSAPAGGVWYPCDGTGHLCTTATGGTTTITPPNYNGIAAAIFGGGYSAVVNSATNTSADAGVGQTVQSGTGVTVAAHTHQHTTGNPANFNCSFWLRA